MVEAPCYFQKQVDGSLSMVEVTNQITTHLVHFGLSETHEDIIEDKQSILPDNFISKANTFVRFVSKTAWAAVTHDDELDERLDEKLDVVVPRLLHKSNSYLGSLRRRASWSSRVFPE